MFFLGRLHLPADTWFTPLVSLAIHFFTEGKGMGLCPGDSRHNELPTTLLLWCTEQPKAPRLTPGHLPGEVRKYNELVTLA